jgi:penicillin amidase
VKLAGVGLALAVGAAAAGLSVRFLRDFTAARAAFPLVEGRIEAEGLGAAVEVHRDALGVPHIEAESEEDAFFGLGFVHAQDRLAQMLWLARSARGRTAEVVGAPGLAADRVARVLDLGGVADARYAQVDPSTRRVLEAYARGVNARIERIRAGRVEAPLAVDRLGIPLEAWKPADSLAVVKLYAWGLSESLDVSLVLSDLIERLGGLGARPFFPGALGGEVVPAPGRLPVTASRVREARPGSTRRDSTGSVSARQALGPVGALRRAAGLEGRSIGSSAWVLGGAHSRSGRPLLAADAHLEPTVPTLLHLDHIQGGELDVAGTTLPGVPVVWTGHSRQVAWASTHARAVTTALYVETLHPTDATLYHDGDGWQKLDRRVETIEVRGGDAELLTVRSTRHGPLIQALLPEERDPISLAWVGARLREAQSIASMLAVARASDADALVAALEKHHEPALAVVYADSRGAAGMQVAGWIPRRGLPSGLTPLPGRARWYDWQGRVPFESLPRARLEAGRGWTVAADNRLASPGGGAQIEWLWRTGERARRIDELLRAAVAAGPVDLRQLAALQSDVEAARARSLAARALELVGDDAELGPEGREVAELLRRWDGRAIATSVGSTVYHVFLESLTEELFGEALGEDLMARYLALPQADPGHVVYEILRSAAEVGGTDGRVGGERVGAAVRRSLREAWLRLSFRLGSNRKKWHWGRLHSLSFRPFGGLRLGAEGFGEIGPFPVGGSAGTVNAAGYDPGAPFRVRVASTCRFAVDAGALDHVLVSLAPGQSEHPRHPHFSDGLRGWLEGDSSLLVTSRLLVEEGSVARLFLEPGT